jgi:hypothetical protein
MERDTGINAAVATDPQGRRSGVERRTDVERRRSARGLFELRARRAGVAGDRRQSERREVADAVRPWRVLWRRVKV